MSLSPNCKVISLGQTDLQTHAEIKHFSPPNSPNVSFNESLMNNVLSAKSVLSARNSPFSDNRPQDIKVSDKDDLPSVVLGSCIGNHSDSCDDTMPENIVKDIDKPHKPPKANSDKAGMMSEKEKVSDTKKKENTAVKKSCDIKVTEVSDIDRKEPLKPKEKDFTLLGARPKTVKVKKNKESLPKLNLKKNEEIFEEKVLTETEKLDHLARFSTVDQKIMKFEVNSDYRGDVRPKSDVKNCQNLNVETVIRGARLTWSPE